jgi:hypothetical protein
VRISGLPSTLRVVDVPRFVVARSERADASSVGTKVKTVGGAGVVAVAVFEAPETLPAASTALTVYVYVVLGATVVSEYVVPVVAPICVPPRMML